MVIYKTTNTINNKSYIGYDTKNNSDYYGGGTYIKRAIAKHGKENFKKEIVEQDIVDHKILCEREKFWIKELNTLVPNGYNITEGGDGGDIFTNNPRKEEICKKISKSHIGKHFTEETRKKMSETFKEKYKKGELTSPWLNKDRSSINNPFYNKKHSEETKRKLSEKMKKKWKEWKEE